MKKKFVMFFILSIILSISSCSKTKVNQDFISEKSEYDILEQINDYVPNQSDIANVYHDFVKYREKANYTKETSGSIQIDSALWESETYLDSTYGFGVDSTCYKYSEDTIVISFDIEGYNGTIN